MTIRIAFVAGANRSGTTLLSQLIGRSQGAIAVGELSGLWRAAAEGDPCSCGETVAKCGLWSLVFQDLEEQYGSLDLSGWADLSARVLRTSRSLYLIAMRRVPVERWTGDLKEYVRLMELTYALISRHAGVDVIVDSSKLPPSYLIQGLIAGVRTTVVHITRDPRAVANSERKSLSRRAKGQGLEPPGRRSGRSAVFWVGANGAVGATGRFADDYMRVSYEQLMAGHEEVMRRIASRIGAEGCPMDQDPVHHIAVGNPSRLRVGELSLTADDSWTTELPRRDVWAVRLISGPMVWVLGRGR